MINLVSAVVGVVNVGYTVWFFLPFSSVRLFGLIVLAGIDGYSTHVQSCTCSYVAFWLLG